MLLQTLLLTPYLAVAASLALTAIVTIICVREPVRETSGFDLTKGPAVRRGGLAKSNKERRRHASSRAVARPAARVAVRS
jgi:hypothetical protein